MNMLFNLASSRYFLYLEDDWLPISKPLVQESFMLPLQSRQQRSMNKEGPLSAAITLRDVLTVSINVLTKQDISVMDDDDKFFECSSIECVEDLSIVQVGLQVSQFLPHSTYSFQFYSSQVLLNDQTFRKCAQFFESPELCYKLVDANLLGLGGWQRHVSVNVGIDEVNSTAVLVPYALHEFGLSSLPREVCEYLHGKDRVNEFALWPGFSLNPGVTDLYRLKALLVDSTESRTGGSLHDSPPPRGSAWHWFNIQDEMFEHLFSLDVHAAGARMAFLPVIVFQHTAANFESAYRLQGLERYWDNETNSA
jgi:hypothetical protein